MERIWALGDCYSMEEKLKYASREMEPAGLIWLAGKMMMAPLMALAYGLDLLNEAVHEAGVLVRRGIEIGMGPNVENVEQLNQETVRTDLASQAAMKQPSIEVSRESSEEKNDFQQEIAQQANAKVEVRYEKESKDMNYESGIRRDRDLQDDMLKLVRYKILFVRRDFEHAFPEREDLVYDSMDGSAFAAWKVAEFIQELQKGETSVPAKWVARGYPEAQYVRNGQLIGLDDEDKKYLRVYYEVLERYVREKFYYEEQQIEILRKIAENMQNAGSGGNGGGASSGSQSHHGHGAATTSSTLQIGGAGSGQKP